MRNRKPSLEKTDRPVRFSGQVLLPGALLLLAITFIAYIPALRAGFIWDDDSYVEHNPALRTLDGLYDIWTNWHATPQYYPLVHTTFWIEYHLWGAASALGYHLTNILLHAFSATLIWRLLRRLNVPGSLLAAAIFAVHPVHVETVAWVTERKNVLSLVFYLLALESYLRSTGVSPVPSNLDTGETPVLPDYGFSLLFFLLALLSKTVTATFPAAILLIVWWKRGRLRLRDLLPLLPFFIAGAVTGSITGYLERTQVGAHGPEWAAITPPDRILIASRAIWFYAGKLLVPWKLTFIYPRWWPIDPRDPVQWLYPVALIAVVAALWFQRHRLGRGPLVGVLFFIGTLVPALGFVNVYPMRYSFVADHFQYHASIGLIAFAAAAIARFKPAGPIIVALLTALTFHRCLAFHDRETLWRDTLAKNPNAWIAHTNLGHIYRAENRNDDAWREYQEALRIAPNVPDTHLDVATQLAHRGDFDAALAECQKVIEIDPTYAGTYVAMANFYLMQAKPQQAEEIARRALTIEPRFAAAHYILARALEQQGKFDAAAAEYIAALSLNPGDAAAHFHLADTLVHLRQGEPAIEHYRTSLAIDPNNAPAWTTLGNLLLASGQRDNAIACFKNALRIDPNLLPAQMGLQRATAPPGLPLQR